VTDSSSGEQVDGEQENLLGSFIRAQRQLANLSLRQLAAMAHVSNPYLSQIERGLHEPSLHVLRSVAEALNLSTETILERAGVFGSRAGQFQPNATDTAIRSDPRLTEAQRIALLAVYRSYLEHNEPTS
jgi:transcriptional regulator with XRE-family HTH domain